MSEETKRCPKCERTLPRSEFSRGAAMKDGLQCYCKECCKEANAAWLRKKRGEDPVWHADNLKRMRKFFLTPVGKASRSKSNAKYNRKNKEKGRAQQAVKRAIRAGEMVRVSELTCEECGGPAREYHHHLGYAEEHQLDVTPLCNTCHKAAHAELSTA